MEHSPTPEHSSDESSVSLSLIPPQYRGMSADALEIVWASNDSFAMRAEETAQERDEELSKRKAVVAELRRLEQKFEQNQSEPSVDISEEERNRLLSDIDTTQKEIYFSKRGKLSDEMFMVSKGAIENEDGTESMFDRVDGTIGKAFDAHGIDKGDQLGNLLGLLSNGIDPNRTFYSAPFEIPDEERTALAAALGTSGGTAYKAGIAVLTSWPHQTLQKDGIKHVFVNDVYGKLLEPLAKLYPAYHFHLLSEQKSVLESEYKTLQLSR